jgi:hypothetical protein
MISAAFSNGSSNNSKISPPLNTVTTTTAVPSNQQQVLKTPRQFCSIKDEVISYFGKLLSSNTLASNLTNCQIQKHFPLLELKKI